MDIFDQPSLEMVLIFMFIHEVLAVDVINSLNGNNLKQSTQLLYNLFKILFVVTMSPFVEPLVVSVLDFC